MRALPKAITLLALASPLLGGCQSIFGHTSLHEPRFRIPAQIDPLKYADLEMASGLKALNDQQYGLAIAAFRNAQSWVDHRAAAFNGLAIAYSQIGRPDLAERFFKQAIAENPGDVGFQANLANFYRNTPELAARSAISGSLATSLPLTATPNSTSAVKVITGGRDLATINAERPEQRTVRISLSEVRITLPTAPAASPTTIQRRSNPMHVAIANPRVRRPNNAFLARMNGAAPATVRFDISRSRIMSPAANEVRPALAMPQSGFQRRQNPSFMAAALAALRKLVPDYPVKFSIWHAR